MRLHSYIILQESLVISGTILDITFANSRLLVWKGCINGKLDFCQKVFQISCISVSTTYEASIIRKKSFTLVFNSKIRRNLLRWIMSIVWYKFDNSTFLRNVNASTSRTLVNPKITGERVGRICCVKLKIY